MNEIDWLRNRFCMLEQEWEATGEPGVVQEMEQIVAQIVQFDQLPEAVIGAKWNSWGGHLNTPTPARCEWQPSVWAGIRDRLLDGLAAIWDLLVDVFQIAAIVVGYLVTIPWLVLILLVQAAAERWQDRVPRYYGDTDRQIGVPPAPPAPLLAYATAEECAYCHILERQCACRR